jgi:RNase P/RNase MRP subunit p29
MVDYSPGFAKTPTIPLAQAAVHAMVADVMGSVLKVDGKLLVSQKLVRSQKFVRNDWGTLWHVG